jgi:hypothetical protein
MPEHKGTGFEHKYLGLHPYTPFGGAASNETVDPEENCQTTVGAVIKKMGNKVLVECDGEGCYYKDTLDK